MPALTIDDLHFHYHPSRPLFSGISLSFSKGKLHGIKGKNGCGKSTFFRLLMGELPYRGTIDCRGKPALVHQSFDQMIAGQFNFEDNLKLAAIGKYPSFFRRLKLAGPLPGFLERFGIDWDKPAKLLSGGQRQILAVMMALQTNPSLLLLDEPTAALDPENARLFFDFMKELIHEKAITAIAVCHDHELISSYADGKLLEMDKLY